MYLGLQRSQSVVYRHLLATSARRRFVSAPTATTPSLRHFSSAPVSRASSVNRLQSPLRHPTTFYTSSDALLQSFGRGFLISTVHSFRTRSADLFSLREFSLDDGVGSGKHSIMRNSDNEQPNRQDGLSHNAICEDAESHEKTRPDNSLNVDKSSVLETNDVVKANPQEENNENGDEESAEDEKHNAAIISTDPAPIVEDQADETESETNHADTKDVKSKDTSDTTHNSLTKEETWSDNVITEECAQFDGESSASNAINSDALEDDDFKAMATGYQPDDIEVDRETENEDTNRSEKDANTDEVGHRSVGSVTTDDLESREESQDKNRRCNVNSQLEEAPQAHDHENLAENIQQSDMYLSQCQNSNDTDILKSETSSCFVTDEKNTQIIGLSTINCVETTVHTEVPTCYHEIRSSERQQEKLQLCSGSPLKESTQVELMEGVEGCVTAETYTVSQSMLVGAVDGSAEITYHLPVRNNEYLVNVNAGSEGDSDINVDREVKIASFTENGRCPEDYDPSTDENKTANNNTGKTPAEQAPDASNSIETVHTSVDTTPTEKMAISNKKHHSVAVSNVVNYFESSACLNEAVKRGFINCHQPASEMFARKQFVSEDEEDETSVQVADISDQMHDMRQCFDELSKKHGEGTLSDNYVKLVASRKGEKRVDDEEDVTKKTLVGVDSRAEEEPAKQNDKPTRKNKKRIKDRIKVFTCCFGV